MNRAIPFLLAAAALPHFSAADGLSLPHVMVVSKVAGACGVLHGMAAFQSSTDMPGGAEFLERFIQMDAARLGKSQDAYLSDCASAISHYDQIMSAAAKAEEQTSK